MVFCFCLYLVIDSARPSWWLWGKGDSRASHFLWGMPVNSPGIRVPHLIRSFCLQPRWGHSSPLMVMNPEAQWWAAVLSKAQEHWLGILPRESRWVSNAPPTPFIFSSVLGPPATMDVQLHTLGCQESTQQQQGMQRHRRRARSLSLSLLFPFFLWGSGEPLLTLILVAWNCAFCKTLGGQWATFLNDG